MELFKKIEGLDETKLHNNFKVLMEESRSEIRKVITDWSDGFIDRDNKFIYEFQTTFNSCYWELYCFAVLKDMKLNVDFTYNAPDFVLKDYDTKETKFFLECTIAEPPKGGIPEYDSKEKIAHTLSVEASTDLSTVRLLNSLSKKRNWFIKHKNKTKDLNTKPFLVALAPFDQPNFQIPNLQAIRRVLYGKDKTIVVNGKYFDLPKTNIIKDNGVSLELGIFTNDSSKEISGVLFSCLATISKASAISNVTDIAFFHNRYNSKSTKSTLGVNLRIKYKDMKEYHYKKNIMVKNLNKYEEIQNTSEDKYLCQEPFFKLDYTETLGDGLNLFLNPYAEIPISGEILNKFYNAGVTVYNYLIENSIDEPILEHENSLFQRQTVLFHF